MNLVLAMLGWIGAAVLLLGYVQTSRGVWPGVSVPFQVCSVAGSIGLGLAAVGGGVWSAAALNSIWVAVGVITLVRRPAPSPTPAPTEA